MSTTASRIETLDYSCEEPNRKAPKRAAIKAYDVRRTIHDMTIDDLHASPL